MSIIFPQCTTVKTLNLYRANLHIPPAVSRLPWQNFKFCECQSFFQGRDALRKLQAHAKDPDNVQLLQLDLSSMAEVKRFAKDFVTKHSSSLNYLINNAGALMDDTPKVKTSEDGLEMTVATNFFGPFVLTEHLRDCLKEGANLSGEPSRFEH